MAAIGDIVVFKHNVCKIESRREKYFEGKDYWELNALFERSLKLYVACDRAELPYMRPVMGKQEALDLIDSIADSEPDSIANDAAKASSVTTRQAKETYETYLKSLSPKDLVPVIKTCHARSVAREESGHNPTAVDKKYLELTEGLLCDELSISLDIPRDEVHEFMLKRIANAKEGVSGK